MKCNLYKRFMAFLIDLIFLLLILFLLEKIIETIFSFDNKHYLYLIMKVLASIIFFLRDIFFNKRSLGKKMMKLVIINPYIVKVSYLDLLNRNFIFMIPFLMSFAYLFNNLNREDLTNINYLIGMFILSIFIIIESAFVIINKEGIRIGDYITNTKVIEE